MRDLALERRVDTCSLSDTKEERLKVVDEELLVIRVDRTQSVVVDQLGLRCQPRPPAGEANF